MSAGFIPDGYTIKGYVKAWPGLYPAVKFEYRPAICMQNREVLAAGLAEDVREKRFKELIAGQVKSWDIRHPLTGEVVPVTVENAGRIQPMLRSNLVDIIMGSQPSDPEPATDEQPQHKSPDANAGNSAAG